MKQCFSFRGKNKYGSKKGDDTDVVKNEIFTDVKTVKLPKVGLARWTLEFAKNRSFWWPLTPKKGPNPLHDLQASLDEIHADVQQLIASILGIEVFNNIQCS